jgi:stage V sporulation protein G
MPSRKNKNEEYRDICFPITPELHKTIKEVVLEAYQNQPAEADEAE